MVVIVKGRSGHFVNDWLRKLCECWIYGSWFYVGDVRRLNRDLCDLSDGVDLRWVVQVPGFPARVGDLSAALFWICGLGAPPSSFCHDVAVVTLHGVFTVRQGKPVALASAFG